MSPAKPRVAALQMVSGTDPKANLLVARRLIRAAVDEGAGLVVLPESFAFMGQRDEDMREQGERDGDGPLQSFLAETADRHRAWIVGGTLPLLAARGDRVRAACLVFDDHGQRVARYDKIHLFDVDVPATGEHYRESAVIEPGEETVVIDTPWGRMGFAICYDLRFPEMLRNMLDKGMEVLAIPAAFTATTGEAHWEILVRARAIENLVHVIAADQGGDHANGRKTHGHSMIIDPWGKVLAHIDSGPGWICSLLDLDYRETVRRDFPTIEHRRLRFRYTHDVPE